MSRERQRAERARSRRRGPAAAHGRRAAPLALLLVSLLAVGVLSCRQGVQDLLQLRQGLGPFSRMPYVQAVDTAGATILWRAAAAAEDSFRYRVDGGSEWTTAPVERLPELEPDARETTGAAPDSLVDRRVQLTGLPAGTRVEYTVVADTVEVGPVTFQTAPAAESTEPVRILAFGDSGWGSESQLQLAELMAGGEWDFAVHTGDIAYTHGTELDFTRRYFHVYQPLLGSVPMFPTPGDHDLRTDGGAPYDRAFEWPAPDEDARWYTVRWGLAQIIALETGDESPAGRQIRRGSGEQLAWLESTLDSLSRRPPETAPRWIIVLSHAPPYSHAIGLSGHGSDTELREVISPLFDRYGVDLVLTGHDHNYERTYPILDEERVPAGCGPVYVVSGGGGASRYARAVAPSRLTARNSRAHHYLRLIVQEDGLEGTAFGVDGQEIDAFRLTAFPGRDSARARPACR